MTDHMNTQVPDEALPPLPLSARVRPDVEAAPWVCEGIRQLEAQLADALAALAAAAGQVEQRGEGVHKDPYPEKCPITRRPYFMTIEHPEWGMVPTYGGPFDSYTIPHMEGEPEQPYHERELVCWRYDHDLGSWREDAIETIPLRVINEEVLNDLLDAKEALATPPSQPQAAEPVPPGFKLVPEIPTQEMVKAGMMAHTVWQEPFDDLFEDEFMVPGMSQAEADAMNADAMPAYADAYRAMLAAAPSASDSEQPNG